MAKKILVTGTSVRSELLQPLRDAGYVVENPTHLLSEDELAAALSSSSGYLLGGDEYASEKALAAAKDLKVIAFLGMGYESFVDVVTATRLRIPVTNTPGTLSNAVAELTIGLLLCSTRKLYRYATEYASGRSGHEEKQRDLAAMHVGIFGLGGIGSRIAEILRLGFGAKVSYASRTRKPQVEDKLGIQFMPLGTLLPQVDSLVIMTPFNDETRGFIGSNQIAAAKPGLILVNTARPEIVDPESLLRGLESGNVSYAAIDGFYEASQPFTEKLKGFIPERLMVTNHIGSLTHDARDGMAKKATTSILNVLTTGKDACIVNGVFLAAPRSG